MSDGAPTSAGPTAAEMRELLLKHGLHSLFRADEEYHTRCSCGWTGEKFLDHQAEALAGELARGGPLR